MEEWDTEEESDQEGDPDHVSPVSDDEDVVPTLIEHKVEPTMEVEGDADESDDEDQEKVDDVAMVPMADILNARYGSENVSPICMEMKRANAWQAKLFYEKYVLRMMSTKDIARGGQIWNTYGDLPNAALLRRYGHVDILPSSSNGERTSTAFPYENPADEVEIRADLLLDICQKDVSEAEKRQKTDIWLSLGGEE